jgi:hypothetical protein
MYPYLYKLTEELYKKMSENVELSPGHLAIQATEGVRAYP